MKEGVTLYKEMLEATVYHLNLYCSELKRIEYTSSEKMVKDKIRRVLNKVEKLAYGIEIELNKEEQTNE